MTEQLVTIQDLHPLNKTINNFNGPNPYSKILKTNLNPYNGMIVNKRAISIKKKIINNDRDQNSLSPNVRGDCKQE